MSLQKAACIRSNALKAENVNLILLNTGMMPGYEVCPFDKLAWEGGKE